MSKNEDASPTILTISGNNRKKSVKGNFKCINRANAITFNGYRYLKSHFLPHQWEFLRSKAKIKALVSGFGGGKTYVFIYETFKQLVANLDYENKSHGWIIYPTLEMAEDLFVQPFLKLLEKAEVKHDYKKSKGQIITESGTITILSLQTPQRLVGAELTFVGFDEFDIESEKLCLSAFHKAIGRLRGTDNPNLYVVTTPEGFKATYKLFVEENKGDKVLIKARTSDNPFLPKEYLETLKNQYDEKLLRQYLEGEFVNLNGMSAYYGFKRETCIDDIVTSEATELLVGMDFNINPMTAVLSVKQGDKLLVFAEYWLKNSNTEQLAGLLKERFPEKDIVVCPDMTGLRRTTSSTAGYSDISILKNFGFRINGSHNPFVRDRIAHVNACFSQGLILIDRQCRRLIMDLEQVTLDEHGQIDKSNPDLTHISDALGYLAWRVLPQNKSAWRY